MNLIQEGIIKKKPDIVKGKYEGSFCLDSVTGSVYISRDSPQYVSGELRLKGRSNGRYPYHFKEMIWELFGRCTDSQHEIEVCSGWIKGTPNLITVDINPDRHPTHIGDGQCLPDQWTNKFDRWYADPPYNEKTAKKMYGTSLPSWTLLLSNGARVVKPRGLLFLLLGNVHMQWHPKEVTQIGRLTLSIIPNQESRVLHCYIKKPDVTNGSLAQQSTPLTAFL